MLENLRHLIGINTYTSDVYTVHEGCWNSDRTKPLTFFTGEYIPWMLPEHSPRNRKNGYDRGPSNGLPMKADPCEYKCQGRIYWVRDQVVDLPLNGRVADRIAIHRFSRSEYKTISPIRLTISLLCATAAVGANHYSIL